MGPSSTLQVVQDSEALAAWTPQERRKMQRGSQQVQEAGGKLLVPTGGQFIRSSKKSLWPLRHCLPR